MRKRPSPGTLGIYLGCLIAAGCAWAGCGEGTPTGETFLALQSDFAPYLSWYHVDLGMSGTNSGTPNGQATGYLNHRASAGATEYPVGTILMKVVESGATQQDWELFGMAKRGGNYNPNGALDWEFFTLRLNADGVPLIVSRGSNPADSDASGHGYGDPTGSGVTCNRCHGISGTERTDHVLSPLLAPGVP